MRKEVRLAGFGGQGIISMGVWLALAVGQKEGREVAQTQSYGPEARGGACKAELVIAEGEIDYIKPLCPDLLVTLSQPALDKYCDDINPEETLVLIDNTLISQVPENLKKVMSVPATRLAEEVTGQVQMANVVMLGAISVLSDLVRPESCQEVLAESLAEKFQEQAKKAFAAGVAYGKSIQGGQ